MKPFDVVVCGAGIAGAAAAYHLAVKQRVGRVAIVDSRPPLTLTSNKGTQGYRNWWPGPDDTMLRFVSRSIDLMEESAHDSGNVFRLSRRGYLFATANPEKLQQMRTTASQVSSFGMGELREHSAAATYTPAYAEGFGGAPTGADLLTGSAVHDAFPYLAPDTLGALHIRRAGFVSGVALGQWLINGAIAAGAEFIHDRVVGVLESGGRVSGVRLDSGYTIDAAHLVITAGPELPHLLARLDIELPLFHELHAKVTVRDHLRTVPRNAPFVIWNDPVQLDLGPAEQAELRRDESLRCFGEPMPAGVHLRPVDLSHGDELYAIWTYDIEPRAFQWPPQFDDRQVDYIIRGCARMIPAMHNYRGHIRGIVDGGFYCKTPENRPLIGPLPLEGAWVAGALSGSGLMSAHAAGELIALHVTGNSLPDYAPAFLPSRYDSPEYRALVAEWGPLAGQL